MDMTPNRKPQSIAVILLLGLAVGAVLTLAAGMALAWLRPEPTSVLRPWWR